MNELPAGFILDSAPQASGMDTYVKRPLLRAGRMAAAGAAALGDIVNAPFDLALQEMGSDFRFGSPSQAIRQTFDDATANTAYSTAPLNAMERVIDDVGEGVVGVGTFIKGVQAASKAIPIASKFAANAGTELASSALSAGAAGTTRELGGGPVAQFMAGLAGGAAGGIRKPAAKTAAATSDDIADQARQAYARADAEGGMLKGWFTNRFIDKVNSLAPQTEAGKTLAGDTAFTKVIEKINTLKNRPLSLAAAQEIDETLGDMVDGLIINGKVSKEGKKILDIQTTFRKMIDDADQDLVVGGKNGFDALKEGRSLWSRSAKLRDIEKIIMRAEMSDNPATAIKSGFRTLASNPARMRGFSAEQKKLIGKAANSGVVADIARVFGSRLIPIITASTGGGLTGSAAAQAATMGARGIATKLQVDKATEVANAIAGGGRVIQRPSTALAQGIGTIAGTSGIDTTTQQEPMMELPEGFVVDEIPEGFTANAVSMSPTKITITPQDKLAMPQVSLPQVRSNETPIAPLPAAPLSPPQPAQELMGSQTAIEPIIDNAAQLAGVNPGILRSIATTESGMNPNAKSKTSSAAGLMQITSDTMNGLAKKYGKEYGFTVKDIITKPEVNALAGGLLVRDIQEDLKNHLGNEPTDGQTYIAYFLGQSKGKELIKNKNSDKIAARVFPSQAKANKNIFFDGRRARTLAELYTLLDSKV